MTEQGDKGKTQVMENMIDSKDSIFVETIGSIDSFQASLGSARVLVKNEDKVRILAIQNDLYEIMASWGAKEYRPWEDAEKRTSEIENEMEEMKGRVKNLDGFLIPGENEVETRINLCRTDCREVERRVVSLRNQRIDDQEKEFDEDILVYFNRLSSYLNVMWRNNLGVK